MKSYHAVLAASFLLSSSIDAAPAAAPQTQSTPSSADASLSCEQIGAELTDLTGAAMDVGLTAARKANERKHMPVSVSQSVIDNALSGVIGSVSGGAGSLLGAAVGMVRNAQSKAEEKKSEKREQELAQLNGPEQQARLDRLLVLNEQYQANCPE